MTSPLSNTPSSGISLQMPRQKKPVTAEQAVNQFEQLLISNILKSSRTKVFEGVLPNRNDEFFNSLLDRERSILISNSVDLKIADSLVKDAKK